MKKILLTCFMMLILSTTVFAQDIWACADGNDNYYISSETLTKRKSPSEKDFTILVKVVNSEGTLINQSTWRFWLNRKMNWDYNDGAESGAVLNSYIAQSVLEKALPLY